jgi:integrative and conjugative element protein (TIGR02256 family)
MVVKSPHQYRTRRLGKSLRSPLQTLQGWSVKLVYRVTAWQRLIIVDQAVEQLQSFAQRRWWQSEAGGALLGRHLLDSHDVVVDEVTTPQATDRRTRFGFFRSRRHELLAQERWRQQAETSAYLGLWHTHPEPEPSPSEVDRRDWMQAVDGDAFEGSRLFFPIVGTKSIRVWTLCRQGIFKQLKEEKR